MRIILLALVLASCSGESTAVQAAHQAEAQDQLVQQSGTKLEKCQSRQRVRDAWLNAMDEDKYRYWSSLADIECTT